MSRSVLEAMFTTIHTIEVVPLTIDKVPLIMETLNAFHSSRVKVTKRKNPLLELHARQPHMLPEVLEWRHNALYHGDVRCTNEDHRGRIVREGAKREELKITFHQWELSLAKYPPRPTTKTTCEITMRLMCRSPFANVYTSQRQRGSLNFRASRPS